MIRKLAHNICRTEFSRQLKYLYLHLFNSKTNLEVLNIYNLLINKKSYDSQKNSKIFEIGINYHGRTYDEGKKIKFLEDKPEALTLLKAQSLSFSVVLLFNMELRAWSNTEIVLF